MGTNTKEDKIFYELVSKNLFDSAFKNSMRDYYAYGFKRFDQFPQNIQTVRKHWKILKRILGERWYFDRRKDGQRMIRLKTDVNGSDNPINDLYFCHSFRQAVQNLNYLFDLDKTACLRNGISGLPVDIETLYQTQGENGVEELLSKNITEYAVIYNWLTELEDGSGGLPEKRPLPVRMNRQLNIWVKNTRFGASDFTNKYKNLSNQTRDMEIYGLLGNLKRDKARRNDWRRQQWEKYEKKEKRSFEQQGAKVDYWFKSELTMEEVLRFGGGMENSTSTDSFAERFRDMCAFFSQYYPLGELGSILCLRCRPQIDTEKPEFFRFKHNYIQKSLYDYNLIDVWGAIENEHFCLIQYSHAFGAGTRSEFIFPLEIRISVANGREYVMYYHILDRSIKALRLEFIDKITVYTDIKQVTVKKGMGKDAKDVYLLSKEELKNAKLCAVRAREMLPYLWGTDVSGCTVDDSWKSRLHSYRIRIDYDSVKEAYIKSRLTKETRKFQEKFQHTEAKELILRCFPTKELRTWLRSLYTRIYEVSGFKDKDFDWREDVEKIWTLYHTNNEVLEENAGKMKPTSRVPQRAYIYEVSGKTVLESEGHGALFNEYFGKYISVLANALLECSRQKERAFGQTLKKRICREFPDYSIAEIDAAAEKLTAAALDAELIDEKGKTRFVLCRKEYLYDFLPLTKAEVRWLAAVLENPLAKVFLPGNAAADLKKFLKEKAPFQVKAFPMEAVCYFDQYLPEAASSKITQSFAQPDANSLTHLYVLYNAMRAGKRVQIHFKNWQGQIRYADCRPAWIEYSRRDNVFRIWYAHDKRNRIEKINLPRIIDIEIQPTEIYDIQSEQRTVEKLLKQTERRLKIAFYQGDKNLPDRILTEFSLWKKKCSYDIESQRYVMTLYYSALDAKEILTRIMGYGPYVKIIEDSGDYIRNDLIKRIERQKDRIEEDGTGGKTSE